MNYLCFTRTTITYELRIVDLTNVQYYDNFGVLQDPITNKSVPNFSLQIWKCEIGTSGLNESVLQLPSFIFGQWLIQFTMKANFASEVDICHGHGESKLRARKIRKVYETLGYVVTRILANVLCSWIWIHIKSIYVRRELRLVWAEPKLLSV